MYKLTVKVYGKNGHRQRESFNESYDFIDAAGARYKVRNCDETGTNAYTLVDVQAPAKETAFHALHAQIEDGIFENSRTGDVELIFATDLGEKENYNFYFEAAKLPGFSFFKGAKQKLHD